MDMMLNGKPADISDFEADELAAAVLISLFSWRKSNPDDGVRAPNRQGWWGDTFAHTAGDRIGSRLWLLQRQKILRRRFGARSSMPKRRCSGSLTMQ